MQIPMPYAQGHECVDDRIYMLQFFPRLSSSSTHQKPMSFRLLPTPRTPPRVLISLSSMPRGFLLVPLTSDMSSCWWRVSAITSQQYLDDARQVCQILEKDNAPC